MENVAEPQASLPPNPPQKVRLPPSVKVALLIFFLASAVALAVLPSLNRASTTPPFGLFLSVGLIMVVLTALLFTYLGKLQLGFGKTALVLGCGYNVVIVLIKLVLSPSALYLANQQQAFNTQNGDPNTPFYYIVVAAVILFLYVGTFRLIYKHFVQRLHTRTDLMPVLVKRRRKVSRRGVLMFVLVVALLLVLGGGVIFLPLIFLGSSVTYLAYVFSVLAIPLLVGLALAVLLAYHSFAAVEQQVVATGNVTLLASFFWLGVSLIVLFHVLWIIFMLALVQIWPFNTYTPK